jgi:hypothetical protein
MLSRASSSLSGAVGKIASPSVTQVVNKIFCSEDQQTEVVSKKKTVAFLDSQAADKINKSHLLRSGTNSATGDGIIRLDLSDDDKRV